MLIIKAMILFDQRSLACHKVYTFRQRHITSFVLLLSKLDCYFVNLIIGKNSRGAVFLSLHRETEVFYAISVATPYVSPFSFK
jgi:hypothetical protein